MTSMPASNSQIKKNSLFIVEVHLALKLVHRHSTFWNKLNRLRIPTGRRQSSWLCASAAEELNQGLPETNPASGQSGTWTQDLHISSPAPRPLGHAASLMVTILLLYYYQPVQLSIPNPSGLVLYTWKSNDFHAKFDLIFVVIFS